MADVKYTPGTTNTNRLIMNYELDDGKDFKVTMLDPKSTLTLSNVESVADLVVGKQFFISNNATPIRLKEAYTESITKVIAELDD